MSLFSPAIKVSSSTVNIMQIKICVIPCYRSRNLLIPKFLEKIETISPPMEQFPPKVDKQQFMLS